MKDKKHSIKLTPKESKFHAVKQELEQAKAAGNTQQIKFWTDILLFLEKKSKTK